MKKILLVCVAMMSFGVTASAQFISVDNVSIPLYEDTSCHISIATIFQDSVTENYYRVDITDENNNRFKVRIGSDWSNSDFQIIAWIDKKYVAVCNWPSWSLNRCVYLFAKPDKTSPKQVIHSYDITDWHSPVVSVSGDWYKIIVPTKNGQKEGWTLNYCPNIYGSCEGGTDYNNIP